MAESEFMANSCIFLTKKQRAKCSFCQQTAPSYTYLNSNQIGVPKQNPFLATGPLEKSPIELSIHRDYFQEVPISSSVRPLVSGMMVKPKSTDRIQIPENSQKGGPTEPICSVTSAPAGSAVSRTDGPSTSW